MADYQTLPTGALTHAKFGKSKEHVAGGGSGGDNGGMEQRATALENEVKEVRAVLTRIEPMIARIDGVLPHLASTASVEAVRSELKGVIGTLTVAIGDRPSKGYMWAILGVLVATVLTATIGGATIVGLFR